MQFKKNKLKIQNQENNKKNPHLEPDFDLGPKFKLPRFLFKNLDLSVNINHGQLSPRIISEKSNDLNFRKFSDKLMDRRTDRWTYRGDFMGCCPTKV